MTMLPIKTAAAVIAVAVAGGAALATATTAQAATGPADDSVRAVGVHAAAEETPINARGSITFRTERYHLSDRAVVSTSPTTIRIVDDSATTQQGKKASLYIQFGYSLDPNNPTVLRVDSGVAIRGYDFATGTYDKDQSINLGPGSLSIDSPLWSEATHAWGHLNSPTERGIDLDVHGVHFGPPS
jgi:hypothetical protein